MKLSPPTNIAIEAIKKAGNILKKGMHDILCISQKEGIHNLVTNYDIQSENFILQYLQKKYPSHSFLSEESHHSFSSKGELQWIIDPLDGTVNFAHRIPVFCISIAAQKNGDTILGVIYQPVTEELFVAEKGKGAYLNNKKLEVSSTVSLDNAFLATGFPYNLKENPKFCIDKLVKVLNIGLPIRRLGSAALDLAYVAAGRFDGYWETNLGPWDVAAGTLLVQEAKGKVTSWEGDPFTISEHNSILATNNNIHEPLTNILKS